MMAQHAFTPDPQVLAEQAQDPGVRRYTPFNPAEMIFALQDAVSRIEQRLAALEAKVNHER
jgi:hypothetical protein